MALKLAFTPSLYIHFNTPKHSRPLTHVNVVSSASRRRHHRRRLLKYRHGSSPSSSYAESEQNLQIILAVDRLYVSEPVNYLRSLLDSSQFHLSNFVSAADEAFDDLRTLVTVDSSTKRVLVSCRRSTVEFVATLVVSSVVITFIFSGLIKFLFRRHSYDTVSDGKLVYRRDRSLGGKEVLVGTAEKSRHTTRNNEKVDELIMMIQDGDIGKTKQFWQKRKKRSSDEKLPNWWPASTFAPDLEVEDKEEYQKMADRLVRAILDNRMRGKDISVEDIVQLRRICKTSGARARIDPENSRYSFYRAAIDFVLDCCESTGAQSSFINIGGEDPRHFISGLSENINVESSRAARMVSASVAARTRSRLLQAWALEIQGNHHETAAELLKICIIHQIFPPDKCSPELEMVAWGLQRQLNVDQRKSLLNTFTRVCGKEAQGSVAEALGLTQDQGDVKDDVQEGIHAK